MRLLPIILACLSAQGALGKKKKKIWRPTTIDMNTEIEFSWCRERGVEDSCGKRGLYHAQCYNLENLDRYLNDNLDTIGVKNGRCVIWEKNNCKGDHTGMIFGTDIFVNHLCPKYNWKAKGSSIKCCGGDPDAYWCADPGKSVKCTD